MPDIMQRPPRPKNERLLTRFVLFRAYLFLGMFEALTGMCANFTQRLAVNGSVCATAAGWG